MHAVRRVLAVTAILGAAFAAVLVGPAPAHASPPDPPCEWEPGQFGTHSTCDGLPLFGHELRVACGDSLISSPFGYVPIRRPDGLVLGYVALLYQSGGAGRICRLAAAHVFADSQQGASCYGFIRRNSDRQTYYTYEGSPNGEVSRPVYDANVTSFAWGRCTLNGQHFDARTGNW